MPEPGSVLDEELEIDDGGRRTLGIIDGTVTQLALAALMLLPTALACFVWPRALAPMIWQVEPSGRRGPFLAPGAFFLLSTLASLLFVALAFSESGGAMSRIGTEVAGAASAGEVWRIAFSIFPLFVGATVLGLVALVAGKLARLPGWDLVAAVRSGFYGIFAVLGALVVGEPLSGLLGDPGTNNVFEPGVAMAAGVMSLWFFTALTSARAGWPRALLMGAITAPLVGFASYASYG